MSRKSKPRQQPPGSAGDATELRIVGGRLRGSKLRYHGDPLVRPMKHRVREAMFNLISTDSEGHHAVDLFAGTGALGLEALSRGALRATFIEKHVPSARIVQENIDSVGMGERSELNVTSAFLWARRDLPELDTTLPWLVFCSPPYAFFVDRQQDMLDLLARIVERAPPESIVLVESDERFDFVLLPGEWNVRTYPPAVIGVRRL